MKEITLRAARVNKGLSLEQVSERVNVSVQTLSKWENMVTFPTAVQLKRLCLLYGCTMNDIFVPDELTES